MNPSIFIDDDGEQIVADSSTSTGLRYQSNFAAGKNAIINGAMNVWQRNTSITVPIVNNSYSGADRFQFSRNGTGSVVTCSRVAFTPGTAPQSGYEGNYFMRFNQTTAGTTGTGAVVLGTGPTITGLTLNDSSIIFEGSSADANETTLTVTNPTADRTITLPDLSGTVGLTSNIEDLGIQVLMGALL